MSYSITGRHMIITPALREYTDLKMGKLEKYLSSPVDANIILSVEKHRHIAELLVTVNGHKMVAKEETNEMYHSIDKVVAALEKRFKKYKDKMITNSRDHRGVRDRTIESE